MEEKWDRKDVIILLTQYSDQYQYSDIHQLVQKHKQCELKNTVIRNISLELRKSFIVRQITFKPIYYKIIFDCTCNKEREIGVESLMQQFCDYIAVNGLKELFNKKIGVHQCASIKNRGQLYGKRFIEKWIKHDQKNTHYAVQADIKKCYPNIPNDKLKKFLSRDVKNPALLWLTFTLIDTYKSGLSIGSYLSQYLCNYYISRAYHYATEQLFTQRKTKKGTVRVRMFSHILFYMDDILILGSNLKLLKKAFSLLREYFQNTLGLSVKDTWRIFTVDYIKNGQRHGCFIDMMGFRFYRDHTTVRRKLFYNARKTFNLFLKKMLRHQIIHVQIAYRVISYYGWFKHTDSFTFLTKYTKYHLFDKAKKVISNFAKGVTTCTLLPVM